MRTAPCSTSIRAMSAELKLCGPATIGRLERRGLEQVVAADGHQAAAHESHVTRGVERRQFAERIQQEHLRVGRSRGSCWCA